MNNQYIDLTDISVQFNKQMKTRRVKAGRIKNSLDTEQTNNQSIEEIIIADLARRLKESEDKYTALVIKTTKDLGKE